MEDIFKIGLDTESESVPHNASIGYKQPNYKVRYDWFVNEYVAYNLDIPDENKVEYNMLFNLFGKSEQNSEISEQLKKFKVSIDDEVPMPEIVLSVCDASGNNKRMVMTRENISCVTAQAKVGKTFLVKLIVSAILKRGVFQNRLLSELPDGRDKILYIDTEQSKFHVKLGLSQIKEMLGSGNEHELNRMQVYQFDAVSTTQRLEFVKWLIYNTHPDFYWVTNYLETIISNLLWKPMTSATIAHTYRKVLTKWQEKTDAERGWFIDWQGHDFSMRGMDSVDAVISSGLGHLTSFSGTDSLPTLYGARKYYGETEFVGGSVNATEHSVMCAGGSDDEVGTFKRLIETYPTGILSVVSDTWDLWKVCTEHVVTLKDEIMARDGKLVIRPDSGDPVDILCGDRGHSWNRINYKEAKDADGNYLVDFYGDLDINEGKTVSPHQYKGVIELLWDVFGGTINEQGYKVLDSHIGAIYGDSITIDRADEICKRLEAKGFASTNVVLGIGSFTYQYNTRDTFGFAMKATYVEVNKPKFNGDFNPEGREIFKDPITDDGTKKSATGLLVVARSGLTNGLELYDKVGWDLENKGMLQTIYNDGKFENTTTLTEIKNRLK